MATIDSKTFLSSRQGYLQKGAKVNIREVDIEKKVADLLPSRSINTIFALHDSTDSLKMVSGREDLPA